MVFDVKKNAYKAYEKGAKYTDRGALIMSWLKMCGTTAFVSAVIGAFVGLYTLDGSAKGFYTFLSRVVGGVCFGVILASVSFGIIALTTVSKEKRRGKITSPEACTDELAEKLKAEARMLNGRFTAVIPTITLSSLYSVRGDNASAAKVLLDFNRNIFIDNPFGADQFYSLLIGLYTESDDLESAEAAYKEGEYFLMTYKNSPSSRGTVIKSSISHLECLRGNYTEAIRLSSECAEWFTSYTKKKAKEKTLAPYVLCEYLAWLARSYACAGMLNDAQSCLDKAYALPHTPAAEKLIRIAENAVADKKSAV